MDNEMIIAAAIQLKNGQVFVGKRHSEAKMNAINILGKDNYSGEDVKTGFITTNLKFLDRKEAYLLATNNGQYRNEETRKTLGVNNGKKLCSDDLW
jgi:hypothetical protein